MASKKATDDEEETAIDVGGRAVRITHPSKICFPARGETKRDLVAYYSAVDAALMRANQNRPVMMQRFPQGAAGPSFYQKRVPENAPPWITQAVVATPNGTTSNALVATDVASLCWAVNLGCLGFHAWAHRVAAADVVAAVAGVAGGAGGAGGALIERARIDENPDELRVDLDPGPGVTFEMVREAGHEVKRLLDDLGLVGFAKTSGSRGLHIYARVERAWDATTVRACGVALARELERRRRDLVTASWWKEERGKRVFVDFNQNCPHKTVFAAWCVRATPNAQVSTPITWDELALPSTTNDAFTIATVPQRLLEKGDPWAAMNDKPQSLAPLLELVAQQKAAGMLDAPWPPVYPKQPGEPPRVQPSRAKKPKPPPPPTTNT